MTEQRRSPLITVVLHQGSRSRLSPFLFVVVMDEVSEICRKGLPWELLSADDLALATETEANMKEKWQN